jgi:fructan beta-fructosidase
MQLLHRFRVYTILLLVVFLHACIKEEDKDIFVDKGYSGLFRPQIHFSSKYNWINDPNGLVYHEGEYHLFFQHNPFGPGWGYMSWGHAVSTDLIHWKQLNVALKPDALGDIFSGCVVIDKNNTAGFGKDAMIAIYTSAGSSQHQSIAFSTDKGRSFIKYRNNPVLSNPGRPDFRDPKVFWYEPAKQWIMSLATGQTISFYQSPDLKAWTKLSEFGSGIGAHGGVWECPDLFPLKFENETKWILLVSINPGAPNGGSGTQYFIGEFNGVNFIADPYSYPFWLDYGKDNYAGITWDNIPEEDGRRIQIAWMNNWEYAGAIPTYSSGGNASRGGMTLPRALSLVKNEQGNFSINNEVVSEINAFGLAWTSLYNGDLSSDEKSFSIPDNPKAYHLQLTTSFSDNQILTLLLVNDNNDQSQVTINVPEHQIVFDRRESGKVSFSNHFPGVFSCPFDFETDSTTFDIYVDQSSIEIIVNDGARSITNQVFPQSIYNKVSLSLNTGSGFSSLKYRRFNSIW